MLSSTKYATPKVESVSMREWTAGVVTNNDEGRTPQNALRSSGNVVLAQDGTIRPRKSLMLYGTQPTGTILGEVYEFVRTTPTGQENYVICMQNVAGTARPYIQKDGGAWNVTTGKTYSTTAKAHFCQVDNKVLIMNGSDSLSYFDITTSETTRTITPFTALTTPSAPTTAKTGLVGTTFTYYYAISANSTVGETIASTGSALTVGKERELWVVGTDSANISWSTVSGATSYNVYMGVALDQMFLVAAGINGLAFVDDGTILNFSPLGGGGNVELGRGSKEFPVRVMAFRDGRGQAQITALCRGTNGSGKRYILSRESITVGTTVIDFMAVSEDNGQAGTDSPDGVVLYDDSLWYPSRDGFKTTGTKPQLQNILSTNRVSNTIQRDIADLNNSAMDNCVGIGFESQLFWALPKGSDTNSEIWVLDLLQKGAWMKPLTVSADWMWLYNDNDGVTHFCILSGNQVMEFTYAQATNDNGVAFTTNASSGVIKFSENGQEWAKVIDVTFVLQRPQGTINLSVSGKTEDSSLATLSTESYNPETSVSGWGEAGWDSYLGWGDSETVPTSYGDALATIQLEVDELLKWWKWDLSTDSLGVDYQLSDVVIRFVRVGVLDES